MIPQLKTKLNLIGICGHAGAGKDTVCEMIGARYKRVYREAFADPLKEAAAHAFGIPLMHFYQSDLKEMTNPIWEISPRQIAQFMGTEMFRDTLHKLIPDIAGNFWVRRMAGLLNGELENNVGGLYEDGDTVVIPDVRFENEVEFIRENGGITLHVYRNGCEGGVGISAHASETQQLRTDFNMFNNGTLERLAESVSIILDKNHLLPIPLERIPNEPVITASDL